MSDTPREYDESDLMAIFAVEHDDFVDLVAEFDDGARRWHHHDYTRIVRHTDGSLWAISGSFALTDHQENEFGKQPYRVVAREEVIPATLATAYYTEDGKLFGRVPHTVGPTQDAILAVALRELANGLDTGKVDAKLVVNALFACDARRVRSALSQLSDVSSTQFCKTLLRLADDLEGRPSQGPVLYGRRDLTSAKGIVEHDDGMERVVRYPSDGRCIIGISGNHRREGSTTVFWCIIGPVTCAGCCPTE